MNARTFTIFALMVGGVVLVLLVTDGARLVAAQADPAVPSVPALPALRPGGMGEDERSFSVPIMAGVPGSPARAAASAATPNAQNVELVGHIGGATYAVFVQGHYAYVGEGPRLTILDISVPTLPTVVGKTLLLPDIVRGIYVSGTYAYVADGWAGLRVVDVSDPTAPAEVSSYDTWGSAYDAVVAGNYAYVADGDLWVIDVTDPTRPAAVGRCDTPGTARGVAVAWPYVYVADDSGGLRVVNISNPILPMEVGYCDEVEHAYDVVVAGSYAYVAGTYRTLCVVDISMPATPTLVGCYGVYLDGRGVAVVGNHAYVAADSSGLRVVDVCDPVNPTEVGFYDTPGSAMGVAVVGGRAHVADESRGLRVVGVSNPAAPLELGSYEMLGDARDVTVMGDYAYVANGDGGLWAVDVSDPAAPVGLGFYDTPGLAVAVTVVRDYAYVADYGHLIIVDVSMPAHPTEVNSYTLSYPRDVVVRGNYAYVAAQGVQVLYITNPMSPLVWLGSCSDSMWSARGVAVVDNDVVADNYVYAANTGIDLVVVDVTYPTLPEKVGSYDTLRDAYDVVVSATYAYVTHGRYPPAHGWLSVVDVSNPISPTGVGLYQMPGQYAYSVAVEGSTAYVANYDRGLRVVDVSDPAHPVGVGFYDTCGKAYGVAATRDYVYVADDEGGLLILRYKGAGAGPLTGVTISGPTTGIVSTSYVFTATISPLTATQPITYIWQASGQSQLVHAGGVSDRATFTWSTTGTQVITVAASNAWGSAHAIHTIVISEPDTGDTYEPDDTCVQASMLTADGTVQQHTFHDYADEDWVRFTVVSGTTYIIQTTSTGPLADTELELHDGCTAPPLPAGDLDLGPDTRLRWTASQDTIYFLRVTNHSPGDYGPHASYDLSVRAASAVGAAIVVAGRNDGRTLHPNINFAANRAARVFLDAGFSRANLHYLNSDPHPGGGLTPDAPATSGNLQHAIETWAADKVGPDRQLYLYLVDHGGRDVFLTDGSGDPTSAGDLDAWLTTLENATECPVNVVIEACRSGSFIDESVVELVDDCSKEGRVVIASTSATRNAYALPGRGAYFSDSFFTALNVGADLWAAFRAGQQAVAAHGLWQTPWLDDDGDATPHLYDPDDGREARRRGLAGLGCSGIAPYIETVSGPEEIVDGRGTVQARVVDDLGVEFVWALVYPPSFEEPATTDEETVELALDSFVLLDGDGDGEYEGSYGDFMEVGAYRVVVYAKDSDDNLAVPRDMTVRTGWQVYLPLVCR